MSYPVIDVTRTGANIARAIRDSAYTVGDVSDFLGISRSNVYKYLRGDVLPSIDNLYALSSLLNVSMNDLLAAQAASIAS